MYFYFVALALFVLSSFFPVYFPFSESKTATSVDTRSSSSSPSLLFFSPDVHDGTMTDLAASLTAFNHSVFFYNYKCSLPAYSEMKRRVVTDQQYVMQDLKQEQPQILFPTKEICKTNKLFSYNMDSVHRIWKLFRGNRVFQQVDAILCMFYPSECQNYIVFNKTVVFIPAHRFLIRRCYNNDSSSLLKWMFNQPKAPVIVMAAGRYDAEYINYYSGKNVPYIISSTILLYTPPVIYSPIWDEFLYAPFKNNIYSKKYKQMVADACTREGKPCFLVNIRERVKGRFHYRDINKFKDWKRIGYLEQNAYSKIMNFPATVYEIVMSNNFADIGLFKFPNKTHRIKVINALKLLGMEKYKNRMISKLSGGQIQRVFLARTLISEPDLLVLDEPTNGVDRETIDLIYKILQDLNKEKKVTIIMVTHDVEKMSNISNRVFCFEEGSLVELEKKQIYDELSHKHKHPNSDSVCSC